MLGRCAHAYSAIHPIRKKRRTLLNTLYYLFMPGREAQNDLPAINFREITIQVLK
jgi:hypothetical protein